MSESEPVHLPAHYSGVRFLSAKGKGVPYQAFVSLDEARQHPDAAAIMEGDYGGQIYFTCPVKRIACSEGTLQKLLADLNSLAWNDGERVYYEVLPFLSGVWGGMGGGAVIDGVWIHEEFELAGLKPEVEAVVYGRQERIAEPAMREAENRIEAFDRAAREPDQIQATWSYMIENDWTCTHCGHAGRADTSYRVYVHPRNRVRQFIICRRCDWPQHLRPQWTVDRSLFDVYCPKCGKPLHSVRARQCTQCGAHWFDGVRANWRL
jgi:hypothetical protein